MKLTDARIRNLKLEDFTKSTKLWDEDGLYLLVKPMKGRGKPWLSKGWRFKYRFGGKEKLASYKTYPEISLSEARELRDADRKLLARGIDPSDARKAAKASSKTKSANSFEVVAREWLAKQEASWAASHYKRVIRNLEVNVFPWIGERAVADLTADEIRRVVQRIEERKAIETAHRTLQKCSQILRYSVATGRASRNPAADVIGALAPTISHPRAAVTLPDELGSLLRKIDGYAGSLIVRSALCLAPLVFVRPGELRHAKWADINLDTAEWRFLVTKTKTPHIVPLATQALAILRDLQPLTGGGLYVFPGARSTERPMSDNAMLAALRSMEISTATASIHGFRATARTLLDEELQFRPDFIEHQLAHAVKDPNGRAYNRTAHLEQRRQMMQRWADYLDELRAKSRSKSAQGAASNDA
jgi:integrase